jgi:hypothetical protein
MAGIGESVIQLEGGNTQAASYLDVCDLWFPTPLRGDFFHIGRRPAGGHEICSGHEEVG